ncbi:hypothetical protein PMI07_000113 [Rhizobium sp. CF080]|uniref:hypothetical protein n=1 Tax=Rhizobium sp. (strain CF080) TaxID=1144310 RepID=UPI0002717768|nr:hypothetical protein [Rhizobium sp. CF080]EUB97553.1 hypothetical protein PMI07_000113 [Rhizobium sp. CF080]
MKHVVDLAVAVVGGLIVAIVSAYFLIPEEKLPPESRLRVEYDDAVLYYPDSIVRNFVLKYIVDDKVAKENAEVREKVFDFYKRIIEAKLFDSKAFSSVRDIRIYNDTDKRIERITFKHEFQFGAFVVNESVSNEIFNSVDSGADFIINYIDPGKSVNITGFSTFIVDVKSKNFLVLLAGKKQDIIDKSARGGFGEQPLDTSLYSGRDAVLWIMLFLVVGILILVAILTIVDRLIFQFWPETYVKIGGKKIEAEARRIVEIAAASEVRSEGT